MGGAAGGMLILSAACVIKSVAMACFGVVVFMCGFSSSWASANWVRLSCICSRLAQPVRTPAVV